MARRATESIPLTPETKQLLKEAKPHGVTFDHWVRNDPRLGGSD
jgi:hypothetical protein